MPKEILKPVFSSFYGIGSNSKVKLLAMLVGVKLCIQLRYSHIQVESDFMLIVNWMTVN